jgi:micrococcal nuclease
VIDGDTVAVRLGGAGTGVEKVRLVGVDAAELNRGEPCSREARDRLRVLSAGETVRLEADVRAGDRDRYGRLLRYVVLDDGRDVNAEMIRGGLARVYRRFSFERRPSYVEMEEAARSAGAGCWGTVWKEAEPPPAPSGGSDPVVYVTPAGGSYHAAGCASLKGSTTALRLSEAARRYRPCRRCRPPAPGGAP